MEAPTIIRIENIPQSEISRGPTSALRYLETRGDIYTGRQLTLYNKTTKSTYQIIYFIWEREIVPARLADQFLLTIWTKKNTPKVSRTNEVYLSTRQISKIIEKKILEEGYEMMDLGLNLSLKIDTVYYPWKKTNKEYKVNLLLTTSKESDEVVLLKLEKGQAIISDTEDSYIKKLSEEELFLIGPLL